jgi:hypothetical protein
VAAVAAVGRATWTVRNLGNALYAVAYGNGRFVAVDFFGAILTSPNGVRLDGADLGDGQRALRRGLRERHASWRWGETAPSSPPRTG